MIRQDDRTDAQRASHHWLVIATDKFMSGWGRAAGGASVCAWACRHDQVDDVEKWVRDRSEMRRVRIVCENGRRYVPRSATHFHVYVVDDDHVSLRQRLPRAIQS